MGRLVDGIAPPARAAQWMIAIALGITATSLLAGCQKPLFPARGDRTQFDQYDRLRGQYVGETVTDAYGQEQPALRERLGRK